MTPDTNWRNAITAAVCRLLTASDDRQDIQAAKALDAACRALDAPDAPADSAGHLDADEWNHIGLECQDIYVRTVAVDKDGRRMDWMAVAQHVASRLSAQRPAPSPRPTVEQLVEIGRWAWDNALVENKSRDFVIRDIARAVRAADAPAVPKEIWERLEKGHPVSDKDWDDLYILMRDVRNWARTLPTAPPIPDTLREQAREIAGRLPAEEVIAHGIEDFRQHYAANLLEQLQPAAALVRTLANGGTS